MSNRDQPTPAYMELVAHYESCLKEFGPTHKGVDWPNAEDLATRFQVMLGVIRDAPATSVSLLDLGCGPGLLLDHINQMPPSSGASSLRYQGIDLSVAMIEAAQARHPADLFSARNVLVNPIAPQSVDYVVMNGVLTEKRGLAFETMENFATRLITAAFHSAKRGIAFNVMSPFVDWQRDDLFHWPFERMMEAVRNLSPHIVVKSDYGLREYTTYIYRDAQQTC